MPRAKTLPAQSAGAVINHENVGADVQAMDADAPRRLEIIERYGDGTPYERLRVVSEARFYMAQGAQAMLEAGKRLVQIKEFEQHGDFIQIVEALGLSPRTAQKWMQAAVKFLLPDLGKGQEKLLQLSATKLYELAVFDDDEIKELAKGSTVAGITLDDVDTMGAHELRAHLREARSEMDAKDRVLDQKNKKIDKLTADGHKKPAWRKQFDDAAKAISERGAALQVACAELATLAKEIGEIEFEGVKDAKEALALQAQLANLYYDLSENLLQQSVAYFVAERGEQIEPVIEKARLKLPEDIVKKIFGGGE